MPVPELAKAFGALLMWHDRLRLSGLRVPVRRRKRVSAEGPDHVCAVDFQLDWSADGRILKLHNAHRLPRRAEQ